ncbi:MAG: very short patch repair endonuclease [Acidobacteriaceae bacterium]|jgi:DNA mismatch endonuclease (patch repair protein)
MIELAHPVLGLAAAQVNGYDLRLKWVTDHVDRAKRSLIMAAVHSKDTKPEMAVRKIVHALGYRYRLYDISLPGRPDLVFLSRRKVIFVHGCFWHRHPKCKYATRPKSRVDFWELKFSANVARDRRTRRELKKLGWTILTVWQCELKKPEKLTERLNEFLAN